MQINQNAVIVTVVIMFIIWWMVSKKEEFAVTGLGGVRGARGVSRGTARSFVSASGSATAQQIVSVPPSNGGGNTSGGRTQVFGQVLPKVHAKISGGKLQSLSAQPPVAAGETHCVQIECPPLFEDDVVCWKCHEITAGNGESSG